MEWSQDTYRYKHQDFKCYIERLKIIIYVNAKSKDLQNCYFLHHISLENLEIL